MSEKKGTSETDLFFVIEGVMTFIEKMVDAVIDDPTKTYFKAEYSKFKEILTSPTFSACACFSYSNSLKLVKQQQQQQQQQSPPNPSQSNQTSAASSSPPFVSVATLSLGMNEQQQQPQQSQQYQPSIVCLPNMSSSNNITVGVFSPTTGKATANLMTSTAAIPSQQQSQKVLDSTVRRSQIELQKLSPFPQNGSQHNSPYNLGGGNGDSMLTGCSSSHSINTSTAILATSFSSTATLPNAPHTYENNNNNNNYYGNARTQQATSPSQGSRSSGGGGGGMLSRPSVQLDSRLKSPSNTSHHHHHSNTLNGGKTSSSITNSPATIGSSNIPGGMHGQKSSLSSLKLKNSPTTSTGGNYNSMLTNNSTPSGGGTVASLSNTRNGLVSPSKRMSATAASDKSFATNLSKISSGSSYFPTSQTNMISSAAHIKAQKSLQIDIKDSAAMLVTSKNYGGATNALTASTQQGTARGGETTPKKGVQFTNSISQLTMSKNMMGNSTATPQGKSILTSTATLNPATASVGPLLSSIQGQQSHLLLLSQQQNSQLSPQLQQNQQPPLFAQNSGANRLLGVTGKTRESITTVSTASKSPIDLNSVKSQSILFESNGKEINSSPFEVSPVKNVQFNEKSIIPPNATGSMESTEAVPIRKRVRKETRKLSLEKFQNMNLDVNIGGGAGMGGMNGGGIESMKVPSKPFLDDLLNAKEKKAGGRPPSPVNKRVGFAEVQQNSHTMFKMDDFLQKERPNPFTNLISQIKQRLDVFRRDTTTLQLISVKFKDIEEIRASSNGQDDSHAAGALTASKNMNGGTADAGTGANFQQRGQVKRDQLKKYSVFAKKKDVQQNLKRVEDQISKDEQNSNNSKNAFATNAVGGAGTTGAASNAGGFSNNNKTNSNNNNNGRSRNERKLIF